MVVMVVMVGMIINCNIKYAEYFLMNTRSELQLIGDPFLAPSLFFSTLLILVFLGFPRLLSFYDLALKWCAVSLFNKLANVEETHFTLASLLKSEKL